MFFLASISTRSPGRKKHAKIKSRLSSSKAMDSPPIMGVAIEHEEPCEGRLSRTVLWEGEGEIPLPDPIVT
jgi:hypothetical protein